MRTRRHARSDSTDRNLSNAIAIVLVSVLLLLSMGAAFALAEEATDQPGAPLASELGKVEVDTHAAQVLPRDDLTREEAATLLTSVFEEPIMAPAEVFDELEVEIFHSDRLAVVQVDEPGGDGPTHALLESTLPLRVEDENGNKELVDLDLVETGSEIRPDNPLVDIAIPTELGEGIAFPEASIEISMVGAPPERTPSVLGENIAFFPNVAEDSDLTVVPTPTGVETFAQLRTPDAPLTQTYRVDLPADAALMATDEGGAAVVREGKTELVVRPPTAVDGAGEAVPVSLEVVGTSLVVTSTPAPDVVYPILVDPLADAYWWYETGNQIGLDRWTGTASAGFSYSLFGPGGASGPELTGLNLYSHSSSVPGGAGARFYRRVPRYSADVAQFGTPPTSYFDYVKHWGINYYMGDGNYNPVARTGIKAVEGQWINVAARNGSQGPMMYATAEHQNTAQNVEGKEVAVALTADSASQISDRRFYVGSAYVSVTDPDNPFFTFAKDPAGWLDGSNANSLDPARGIDFLVSDPGLGVWRVTAKIPATQGGLSEPNMDQNCTGYQTSPCPREWESSFNNYNPAQMPQGENVVKLIGRDPIAHVSSERVVKVKVDRSQPQLSLSGNLTAQATVGSNLREYTLNYTATDGDDATAAAMTPWGTAGKGEGQLERPFGVAAADDGSFYAVDRINNRVVKYDKEGKVAGQFGSLGSSDGQFNDPRGIALAPDGTVWVADLGNDRIQAFSPSGAFLRKVKFSDPAAQPYAIAVAPNGSIWVTDIGIPRVVGFKDNPVSNLGAVYGKQSNPSDAGTDLGSPVGVTVDKYNNVWVTDNGIDKVLQFDANRKWKFQFGAFGSGPGQFQGPIGIDIAPSGNLAVMERDTNRVEIFKPDGTFLRQYGSGGSASSQFSEAGGLSFAPDNTLLIADAGNRRIARWSHADQDPQSGASKVVVTVDGATVHSKEPGCPTKNCSVSGNWTLDADDFVGGAHKLEVTATDAAGIPQAKTIDIETHGDHTDPAIALSGTMTQQASIGTTRPNYKLKAVSTDIGPDAELKSGVANTVIKVDGTVVDSSSPGCPAGGCSITREWTLNSESYSVGSHTVEVRATDAAGRLTTKTLTINIARDTTAPEVSYMGAFYSAPSGWLEQKQVGYSAFANDSGYGVTSIELKIDGQTVNSTTQPCVAGGCMKFFATAGQTLNMAEYSGGAHPAEFIARDGAGNAVKRSWMINVNPDGVITVGEATDTLEAYEDTAPKATELTPVNGLVTEVVGEDGLNPQLTPQSGELKSAGVPAPTSVSLDPDEGFALETVGLSEEGEFHEGDIEILPVQISAGASEPELTDGSAAVISNSAEGVDTILRPAYNGLMSFQAIRDPAGPEEYSWEIFLNSEETLKLLDPEQAAVVWPDGTQAMLITATRAHGADGSEVQTSLSLSGGNVLTLTVHHQKPGVVYPVVAGIGWQGGFRTEETEFEVPPPPEEEDPDAVSMPGGVLGSPVPAPMDQADQNAEGASASTTSTKYLQTFMFPQCAFTGCGDWEQRIKGFFWYNYRRVWFPDDRDPMCPNHGFPALIDVEVQQCAWVGPNRQVYGDGYHITARVLFSTTALKVAVTKDRHISVYAYGSGYANEHDTDCICNPLPKH